MVHILKSGNAFPVLLAIVTALTAPLAASAATLEGSVIAASTGEPPAETVVRVYRGPFQLPIRETTVLAADGGAFRFEDLEAGRYFLAALSPGLTTQWYRLHDCPIESFCFTLAQPVDVTGDATRSGLDFVLEGTGTVVGRVTTEATGQGLSGAVVRVSAYGSAGVVLVETTTAADGTYVATGVPAENVIVAVHQPGFESEYFDDVPYSRGAYAAHPIPVAAGSTATANFALRLSGRLRIQVVAAETGLPLANPGDGSCSVQVIPVALPSGSLPSYICTADGSVSLASLAPGSYYVTTSNVTGRAPAVYGTGTCNRLPGEQYCDLAGATPVEVRSGEDSDVVVLAVEKEVRFKGTLAFDDPQHQLPPAAKVHVYDELGRDLGGSTVTPFTLYTFEYGGFAPGRYTLTVDGLGLWQSFAWPNAACSRWYCDPQRGQTFTMAAGDAAAELHATLTPIAAYQGCTPSETALCLNQGRFRVEARWSDFGGASGSATAQPLTAETGYFYFFSPDNLEVMVKALNACTPALGHHFWIYGAGLTNVRVELMVTDTLTGAIQLYSNDLGEVFQPILDSGAFATCDAAEPADAAIALAAPEPARETTENLEAAPAAAGEAYCEQNPSLPWDLCLGGRYQVKATWRTPSGAVGVGFSQLVTADTGVFSFFSADNLELVIKVLDACHLPTPRRWVFASGLTDVEVDLSVEDLATGRRRDYHNGLGAFAPIFDLDAFPCD